MSTVLLPELAPKQFIPQKPFVGVIYVEPEDAVDQIILFREGNPQPVISGLSLLLSRSIG